MKRSLAAYAVLLAILLIPTLARAEPYQLFARFTPTPLPGSTGGAKTLEIDLQPTGTSTDPVAVIPRSGMDYTLDGVYIRLRTDDISKSALLNYEKLSFEIECERCNNLKAVGEVATHEISLVSGGKQTIPANTERLVFANQDIISDALGEVIDLKVHSKFSKEYLCAVEQQYRAETAANPQKRAAPIWKIDKYAYYIEEAKVDDDKTAVDCNPPPPPEGESHPTTRAALATPARAARPVPSKNVCNLDKEGLYALGYLSSNPVAFDKDNPLVYSFCAKVENKIQWQAVVQSTLDPKATAADKKVARDKARDAQRSFLKDQLIEYLKEAPRSFQNVQILPDLGKASTSSCGGCNPPPDATTFETVQVAAVHSFTVIKEMANEFEVWEHTGTIDRRAEGVVDQKSDLIMKAHDVFCAGINYPCSKLVPYLQVFIEGKRKDGVAVKYALDSAPVGTGWKLGARLADFLRQTVTLKIYYKREGNTIEIAEQTLNIEDIGLSTTVPIFTEISSAVKRGTAGEVNPTDNAYHSTIPVSWAFNLTCKEGAHGAVTFPWMISFNTRSAPRLSDYFAVFPHVSVVLPLSTTAGTGASCNGTAQTAPSAQVAFGAGLSLVKAFSVSWSVATTGQQFLLLGVSLPDLVGIVQQ